MPFGYQSRFFKRALNKAYLWHLLVRITPQLVTKCLIDELVTGAFLFMDSSAANPISIAAFPSLALTLVVVLQNAIHKVLQLVVVRLSKALCV